MEFSQVRDDSFNPLKAVFEKNFYNRRLEGGKETFKSSTQIHDSTYWQSNRTPDVIIFVNETLMVIRLIKIFTSLKALQIK